MGHHWCSTPRHRLRSTWCLPEHVSGRAWTTDGRAGIAAPSYADSLVISRTLDMVRSFTQSEQAADPVALAEPGGIAAGQRLAGPLIEL